LFAVGTLNLKKALSPYYKDALARQRVLEDSNRVARELAVSDHEPTAVSMATFAAMDEVPDADGTVWRQTSCTADELDAADRVHHDALRARVGNGNLLLSHKELREMRPPLPVFRNGSWLEYDKVVFRAVSPTLLVWDDDAETIYVAVAAQQGLRVTRDMEGKVIATHSRFTLLLLPPLLPRARVGLMCACVRGCARLLACALPWRPVLSALGKCILAATVPRAEVESAQGENTGVIRRRDGHQRVGRELAGCGEIFSVHARPFPTH